MDNIIRFSIGGGTGHMTINLLEFFPCTAEEIRRLDKVCIRSDLWNNDPSQIWISIYEWIQERIRYLKGLYGWAAKDTVKQLERNLKTVRSLIGG